MRKVYMMLLTLAVSTFFIHVPDKGSIGFILNPEVKLTYNQYFWMICEHLILVILALIIWDESNEYRRILFVFVLIQIADVIAFVLAYDDPLKNYTFTWNIVKTLVFMASIGLTKWTPWIKDN